MRAEDGSACAALLERALAWYRAQAVVVERVLTNNELARLAARLRPPPRPPPLHATAHAHRRLGKVVLEQLALVLRDMRTTTSSRGHSSGIGS